MDCERLRTGEVTPLEVAVLLVTVGRTELLLNGCSGGLPLADDDGAAEVSRRGAGRLCRPGLAFAEAGAVGGEELPLCAF